jgi:hypothetical protein
MSVEDDGSIQLMRPVTGFEAIAAITKLQELGGQQGR